MKGECIYEQHFWVETFWRSSARLSEVTNGLVDWLIGCSFRLSGISGNLSTLHFYMQYAVPGVPTYLPTKGVIEA